MEVNMYRTQKYISQFIIVILLDYGTLQLQILWLNSIL